MPECSRWLWVTSTDKTVEVAETDLVVPVEWRSLKARLLLLRVPQPDNVGDGSLLGTVLGEPLTLLSLILTEICTLSPNILVDVDTDFGQFS